MSQEAYRTLIFDRLELEILLNLSGCQRLYGFFDQSESRASKEEVYMAIASLLARKCLIDHQGRAVVGRNLKVLFEHMNQTVFFLKIKQSTAKQPEYICYFTEEKVIVSFCSVLREYAITLVEMEKESFFHSFIIDVLSDSFEKETWNPENTVEEEIQPFFQEVLLACELWKNERMCGKICLMESIGNPYIFIDKENKWTKKKYKPEVFEAILREMISEEELYGDGRGAGTSIR